MSAVAYDSFMGQRTSSKLILAESDTVELKETWTEDALADLAAFANTRGGTLYLGVRNSGEIVGCDVSDDAQQRIGTKIRNVLQIGAAIRVPENHDAVGAGQVLEIAIERSRSPVLLRGSYWVRMGTITVKATPEQWVHCVLRQIGLSWDSLPAERASIADIDADAVHAFLLQATGRSDSRLPKHISTTGANPSTVLSNLGLLPNGHVANAAVLLFGKRPSEHFFQSRIRIARFPGGGAREIVEYPEVRGTVFQQIEGAMRLLEEHMPHRMTFPEGPGWNSVYRHEEQLYPSSVAREAIVNAVIHRDYVTPGGDIQVRILDDEFQIRSPGGLMPGMTTQALYRPHGSIPRNPLVAQVAYYVHAIERWGTGTTSMVEQCVARSLPPPEFTDTGYGFSAILRRTALNEKALAAHGLNSRQIKAVLTVGIRGELTAALYRKLTDASQTTSARDIQDLEHRGIVMRIGTGRDTRYQVRMQMTSHPVPSTQ